MKNRTLNIIIFSLSALILLAIPYSRDVDGFSSDDNLWDVFGKAERYRVFDVQNFSFRSQTDIPEEIKAMHEKPVRLKGFLYSEIISGDTLYVLSDTRQDVCAFCNHDEHGQLIQLHNFSQSNPLHNYSDDDEIELSGIFQITDSLSGLSPFALKNIHDIQKTK